MHTSRVFVSRPWARDRIEYRGISVSTEHGLHAAPQESGD